ncbi:MAG: NAD(P)H-hydrate dehydratase, partial [Anaerolineae bacterium]
MRILSVSEVQALEAAADAAGQTYAKMMARAGDGVARTIQARGLVDGKMILALIGPGNNGGDGLVAARLLQEAGAAVTAYLSRDRDAEEDAVYHEAVEAGVHIQTSAEDKGYTRLDQLVLQADVIVDALLGTGATPPLRGTIAEIVEIVSEALSRRKQQPLTSVRYLPPPSPPHPEIVAVDGPSGLDHDTGEIDESALKAHVTVTFATPKWGHVNMPGAASVGELIVADIGIGDVVEMPQGPSLTDPHLVQAWLPKRPMDAHKGTFGKAMIVAGSANYTGAAILASTAALRAGTGLVTLALPSELHAAVVAAMPEITYLLLPHSLGVLNEHAVSVLMDGLEDYDALLIGPGLGNTPETRAFLTALLGSGNRKRHPGFLRDELVPEASEPLPPLIIDADGLNILSQMPDWPDRLPPETVLTPHPGEMSRLTGLSVAEIQSQRVEIAQAWADTWGQTVVLKGAFTVIAGPDREPELLPFANPGLSSAGTGDVLAGTIVALRAQGLGAFEAAVAGGYLHGLAGEIVTRRTGLAGTSAGDVMRALPEAWHRVT